MFHQVFNLTDIPRVGALAFIETILSMDNAIVLGLLIHSLPPLMKKKALYIGLASAFVLRAVALLLASFILQSHWLEAIGGAYLVYLGVVYFFRTKKPKKAISPATHFWKTVILIEIFDLLFAFDSIIAGIAFIAGPQTTVGEVHPKLWIVYTGGMLGVIAVRYAADLFSSLIERFPNLAKSAHLLVAWIGLKLCVEAFLPHMLSLEILFWVVFTTIFFLGFWRKKG
jgi:YkoY family integral membrane protein